MNMYLSIVALSLVVLVDVLRVLVLSLVPVRATVEYKA